VSALAEALLAAQRQAIGALSKAFVAGKIDAEVLAAQLDAIGLRDDVDQGLLIDSLTIVKALGGEAPKPAGTNGAPKEAKPASEAQWKLLRRLADERSVPAPEGPLTVEQASKIIEQLKAGSYVADEWAIPF
jgi:hypothetical protein